MCSEASKMPSAFSRLDYRITLLCTWRLQCYEFAHWRLSRALCFFPHPFRHNCYQYAAHRQNRASIFWRSILPWHFRRLQNRKRFDVFFLSRSTVRTNVVRHLLYRFVYSFMSFPINITLISAAWKAVLDFLRWTVFSLTFNPPEIGENLCDKFTL